MAFFFLRSLCLIGPWLAAAQNTMNSVVLCVPGQCLQGYSSVTYRATLSAPVTPLPVHLLPGQYSLATNPQSLHDMLSSPGATLTSSAGLPDSLSLPLDLSLRPGFVIFSGALYSGQPSFSSLPNSPPDSNSSIPITANSFALSHDVVAIVASSLDYIVIWDPVPDVKQLPFSISQFSLVGIQSTGCSPACSSAGTCSPDGKCVCADGFTGASCEDCVPGHFGPNCQKCDDRCELCDEGISGTGVCLQLKDGGGGGCNCLNGVCGSDGECQCTSGFAKADNGTQCAKCADGFFETSAGDCKVCPVGCSRCVEADAGGCLACKAGYTQDRADRTKCVPIVQKPPQIPQACPAHTFYGFFIYCDRCDSSCDSCSGKTPNDCTMCAPGFYMLGGVCVRANGDGICENSSLIADNTKRACDACGAKCLACKIPNFSNSSLASDIECTSCVPGAFLSEGKCVSGCPAGKFLSSRDNSTCEPCDSSCNICSGSATFCTSCSEPGYLAWNGTCVAASSCPENTFNSPSAAGCLPCHPDCAACSGAKFNDCTSCPPARPVLRNGQCTSTCEKSEYWDSGAQSCRACDSSCGSCSGPDLSSCLSCSNASDRVLRAGACVATSNICTSNTTVINNLGVCLSELVTVTEPSETATSISTSAPVPTSGSPSTSTVSATDESKQRLLPWWQILLMSLGGVFMFLVCLWCMRRWIKKRREGRRHINPYAFSNVMYPRL